MPTPTITLPAISAELIKALDARFPDKCPKPDASDRSIWIAVGQRQVVELLIEELRRQSANVLTR